MTVSGRDEGKELPLRKELIELAQSMAKLPEEKLLLGKFIYKMTPMLTAALSAAQTRACVEQREQDAKVGHTIAFEFLNMHREQRMYGWHDVEDALSAGSKAVRTSALALSGTTLEQLLDEERMRQVETDIGRIRCWLEGTGASIEAVISNPNLDPLGKKLAIAVAALLAEERAKAYERCARYIGNGTMKPVYDTFNGWATEARTATGGGGE